MLRFCLVAIVAYSLSGAFSPAQNRPQNRGVEYGPTPTDLANALAQMARSSKLPLIAELSQPLPQIEVTQGTPLSPTALNALLVQAPGYAWKQEGKTVHFYNVRLRDARFNFLNLEFSRFTLPSNLSELKLWLPGRAVGLLEGFSSEGGATTGFGSAELQKETLRPVALTNVSPLEVLLHAANEKPIFYTVIVFPSASPSKEQAEKEVNWFWGTLAEKMIPLYAQPVRK